MFLRRRGRDLYGGIDGVTRPPRIVAARRGEPLAPLLIDMRPASAQGRKGVLARIAAALGGRRS